MCITPTGPTASARSSQIYRSTIVRRKPMHIVRSAGNLQLWAFALLIVAGAFTIVTYPRSVPPQIGSVQPGDQLQAAAQQSRGNKTEQMIWTLQERIRRRPTHVESYALLGGAYLQRARETGDSSFYNQADAVLDEALKRDPQHLEALLGKGALALARHEFREALALGEQARQLHPDVPRVYGVIGDAQIELGLYDAAVETIQTMVDLRPDLGSYSRVSYLRELHGDLPGAIEAMQQAIRAGGSTAENSQWVRVQLGNLYFNHGELGTAETHYAAALAGLPDYVPALAGLARVRAAQQRYDEAIKLLNAATQRVPLAEYVIALGDVYARSGDKQQAEQQYELVKAIDKLAASNGVNTDLETALFLADHDIELQASLAKARAAYAARPSIHSADVLAWTLFKTGDYAAAEQYAAEALRLGTQDPLKLFHAGMIATARGHDEQARTYLLQALQLNPHFSLLYQDQAVSLLRKLGGTVPSVGSK